MTTTKIISVAPAILSEGFNDAGLYAITMKLHKRTVTVTEPKFGVGGRQSQYARQVIALDIANENEKNELILNYSSAAAVSSGDVPTAEQFREMADADIKFWIAQARRVASQLFDWMDKYEALTKDQQKAETKKKGTKRGK